MHERYRVLEHIDSGGMAEVFRGVATSLEGFDKIVAIKRILPQLTRKRRFVQMFLDEAKVALSLTHANLVQVFDLGHVDDTYFIVMEYIDGINLRTVYELLEETQTPLSISTAIHIIAELCRGLAYAHSKSDVDGNPLHLVHRDVSPPNIMLSAEGEVKLTDFGLAKAKSQVERTDPGLIKGKHAYLSPEAAYGEAVDHRSDIFSAGIVLWELITGQRLFLANNEHETLKLVRKARVPAISDFIEDCPPQLEEIVRRALARDRADRYQDAGDLAEDLTSVLFEFKLRVGSRDISELVRAVRRAIGYQPPPPLTQVDKRDLDLLIQDEIERFISIELPVIDLEGQVFEDPSKWFSELAPEEGEDPKQLQGQRVGPVSTMSQLIPIIVPEDWSSPASKPSALEERLQVTSKASDSAPSPPSTFPDLAHLPDDSDISELASQTLRLYPLPPDHKEGVKVGGSVKKAPAHSVAQAQSKGALAGRIALFVLGLILLILLLIILYGELSGKT